MRWRIAIALFVCGLLLLGNVSGQEEAKSTTQPVRNTVDPNMIWNFQFEGKKRRGQFIELLRADEARGRALMITHLELRTRTSTRLAIVEHRKVGKKRKDGGFKKYIRRSELFSLGWPEATTQYVASGFSTLIGMKFEAGTRPAIEVTLGGGNMAVYAEGYWSRP